MRMNACVCVIVAATSKCEARASGRAHLGVHVDTPPAPDDHHSLSMPRPVAALFLLVGAAGWKPGRESARGLTASYEYPNILALYSFKKIQKILHSICHIESVDAYMEH
jgi:hypothetical protein